MVVSLPCKICFKAVANSHHAIQCDNYNIWVYVKCNKINTQRYKFLQKSSAACYCIKCSEEIYPFLNISNEELFETNQGKKQKIQSFLLKKILNIDLIDTLTKAMVDPDSEMMTVKYYEPDEISVLLSSTSPNRSFFHLNISSLTFHFDELLVLMTESKLNFDSLAISETRLKLNRYSLKPISMPGCDIEHILN